jgi:hypothetical protein
MVDLSSATGDPIFTASVLAQGCVLTHHAQEANFIIIGIALLSPFQTAYFTFPGRNRAEPMCSAALR